MCEDLLLGFFTNQVGYAAVNGIPEFWQELLLVIWLSSNLTDKDLS